MVHKLAILRAGLVTAAALALAACGSDSADSTGKATFYMTDAPVDEADAVVLGMTHFELKPTQGPAFRVDFDAGLYEDGVAQLNILDYTKGLAATLVSGEEVPAGDYEWLRIFFDESRSYIEIEGAQYSVFLSSGAQTGYNAVGGFTVPVNEDAAYMLDFDVRKSVLEPPGLGSHGEDRRFLLNPTVRLMNLEDTGGARGIVAVDLLAVVNEATCAGGDVIYVFSGSELDLLSGDVRPLTSDIVTMSPTGFSGEYAVMYLLPGEYTLALTCSANLDTQDGEEYTWPPADEDFGFSAIATVEVLSGEVVECDFVAAGEREC